MSDPWNDRDTKNKHRGLARKVFWEAHDQGRYRCPDCGRQKADLLRPFEIHHKNGDPMDNSNGNLVGLCRPCHNIREDKKPSLDEIENLRDAAEPDETGAPSAPFRSEPARIYTAGRMDYRGGRGGDSWWRTPIEDVRHPAVELISPRDLHFNHGGGLVAGVTGKDLELLDSSDGIVAYFDKREQVGTLTELMHALKEQKPAFVAFHSDFYWDGEGIEESHERVDDPMSMRCESPIYWFLVNYLLGDGAGNRDGGDWDGVDGDVEVHVVEDAQSLQFPYYQWVEVRR